MKISENRYLETSRPAMYRALKYWGKKPHNIWNEIICEYSKPNDIVFDPFAGSGLTFFECIKAGRFPIVSDINPLTNFIVDVYSSSIDYRQLNKYFDEITNKVYSLKIYKDNYLCKCKKCGNETDIYNYLFEKDVCAKISYKCKHCGATISEPIKHISECQELEYWLPNYDISNFQTICKSTIERFGGADIKNIWPKNALQILSAIFHYISTIPEPYRKVMTFAFLQTVHLTTKMCAARSEKTNRPLSTSWGRPAYMYLKNRLEQNPLIQFKRAFSGPNGIVNAFDSRDTYLKPYEFSSNISFSNSISGIALYCDTKALQLPEKSVDLIITDPPYGDIIQYGELCVIWNVWLTKMYPQYEIDLTDEIIVKDENSENKYVQDMVSVFNVCEAILKDKGKCILTFNSNRKKDWELIFKSIKNSSFNVVDYFSQNNLRSSEANVAAKTGQAISDYYIILSKNGRDKSDVLKQIVFSKLGV